MSIVTLGTFCLLLVGCKAPAPPPVSITQAITSITDDLGKFRAISLLDTSLWSEDQAVAFTKTLRTEQCRQHVGDPIIVSLKDSVLLHLTGNIEVTGGFSVSSSGAGLPALGISGTDKKQYQQVLDIPVTMVPLSTLPMTTYVRQKEAYAPIWADKIPGDDMTYGDHFLRSRLLLDQLVQSTITSYEPQECQPTLTSAHTVFYGAKKR